MAEPRIESPSKSLADLLGAPYVDAVCSARAFLEGSDAAALRAVGNEKVDFLPAAFQDRIDELLPLVGTKVCGGLAESARGAGSRAFREASRTAPAPLSGLGLFRVGEDGRLYLASKAEHYHLSLGHGFPGFRLVENARRIGIVNTTHNNTRGHVTRLAERELVAAANGLPRGDPALDGLIDRGGRTLNRVINLETGSLVMEAALKMVLAGFYRPEGSSAEPRWAGRIPVFLVMGDRDGGTEANYHGTTVLAQALRGLWPELSARLEAERILAVRPVRINDIADFRRVIGEADRPPYKAAAFLHELVLMNYGAVRLREDYVREAHALCRERDAAVAVDEIQSCAWSPQLFLFREYGLEPDFVAAGKGFPGGEYPAARVLFNDEVDRLGLFGALVTNGQEELASLTYLVTAEFLRANGPWIRGTGELYERELDGLARRYPGLLEGREGLRHLSGLRFREGGKAASFAAALNRDGIDVSVQSYKANCPPSCLTKLPVTATPRTVAFLAGKMDAALRAL